MPVGLKKGYKRNHGETIEGIGNLGEMVNVKKLPGSREKRKHYEMNTERIIPIDDNSPDTIREDARSKSSFLFFNLLLARLDNVCGSFTPLIIASIIA